MKKSMDGGEISEQVHKQGLGNESYSMKPLNDNKGTGRNEYVIK